MQTTPPVTRDDKVGHASATGGTWTWWGRKPQVHVAPPIIEDLRHSGPAESLACPGVQCVDAFSSNSGSRSVKFHREVVVSRGGASSGDGTPARSTRQAASNPFFQVIECLAVDPFEPVLLDAHSAEETEYAYNPPPPSIDQLQQALRVFGTPACSGLVEAFDAHDVSDSLAVSVGSGLVEQALGENQEMQGELEEEEDVPRAVRTQRYSKVKRDRYRLLVDGLVEKYREGPANFDLSEQKLPPGIAASDALKDKLLATVMKLATSSVSGAAARQGG